MKSGNTGPIIAMILAFGIAFGAVGWAMVQGVIWRLDLLISERRDLILELRDIASRQRDFTPRHIMGLSERVTRVEERVTILEERAREK